MAQEAQRQAIMEAIADANEHQLRAVIATLLTDDNLDMVAEAIMYVRGDVR